jgi:hypothetical protein
MPLDTHSSRIYGAQPRRLPEQDHALILRLAHRWQRGVPSMQEWSRIGTQAVDFFEGRQWTQADLEKLKAEGRPSLVINRILPLVNLVLGYHINTRTQDGFLPGHDGSGTAEIAAALTAVSSQVDEMNAVPYVDTEVFLDGLLTGRGYYDSRIDFSRNALGEIKIKAVDPFTVYLDPDASDYDLNTGAGLHVSRWISLDEVGASYGQEAMDWVSPLMGGSARSMLPGGYFLDSQEITPWRNFGGDQYDRGLWGVFTDQMFDWVDQSRKNVRLLDIQHWVATERWFFIDMETGDQKPVPDQWDWQRIERVMIWATENAVPLVLRKKMTRRLRWTHMVADVIVFDEWSPYESVTLTPFFPYFRRGMTKGMVEPLLDPQREVNVRRSARQNIIGRSSNGGWKYAAGSLTPQMKARLEAEGGRPGFNLEYQIEGKNGQTLPEPHQIQPAQSPVSITELEHEARDDLMEIAGINRAALGQVDQSNISGRAILARQQGTVIGLEGFMANYHRSKEMLARRKLELIQNFYTEPRIIRVIGKGTNPVQTAINQRTAAGVVNDVSLGTYAVRIDETSLTQSFLAGQFHELMEMKAAGMPIPDSFIIDASSVARKDELRIEIARAREAMAAAGVPADDAPGQPAKGTGPGGSAVGADGGSMPADPGGGGA